MPLPDPVLVIVSHAALWANTLASHLLSHDIYALCCSYETALFTCDRYDTGGVLIDGTALPHEAELLCRRLRGIYPRIPLAALLPQGYVADLPADRILRPHTKDAQVEEILDFCHTNCGFSSDPLSTFYLSLGRAPGEVVYMGYPMPLTPQGHALLKVLLYRAPKAVSHRELLALCYPLGGKASNLGVQIHRINQAARQIDPRTLIENVRGEGYRIRDGILM